VESDPDLREALQLIEAGHFSHGDRQLFRPLTENLLYADPFLVCADFRDYVQCQERVGKAYADREQWVRKSILNVARCGSFSSDRAVREYNEDIWRASPLPLVAR
jgi:starch phosphorylase